MHSRFSTFTISGDIGSAALYEVLDGPDLFGRADERLRDKVHVLLYAELQVGQVLGGGHRALEGHARSGDALLAVTSPPLVTVQTMSVAVVDSTRKFDKAVSEQDAVALLRSRDKVRPCE